MLHGEISCFRSQYRNSPYRVCSLTLPGRTSHLPVLHHCSLDRNTAMGMGFRRCCLHVTSRQRSSLPGNDPILLSLTPLDSSRNNVAGERVMLTNGTTNPPHSKIPFFMYDAEGGASFSPTGPFKSGE